MKRFWQALSLLGTVLMGYWGAKVAEPVGDIESLGRAIFWFVISVALIIFGTIGSLRSVLLLENARLKAALDALKRPEPPAV